MCRVKIQKSQKCTEHTRHTDSRAPDADGLRPTEPETADTRVVPYPMRSYGLDPGTRGAVGYRGVHTPRGRAGLTLTERPAARLRHSHFYPMRSYGLDPGTRGAGGIRTRDPSRVKLAVNIHTPPEPEASGPATRAGIAIGPRQPAAAPAGCRRGAVYSCSRVGASA